MLSAFPIFKLFGIDPFAISSERHLRDQRSEPFQNISAI